MWEALPGCYCHGTPLLLALLPGNCTGNKGVSATGVVLCWIIVPPLGLRKIATVNFNMNREHFLVYGFKHPHARSIESFSYILYVRWGEDQWALGHEYINCLRQDGKGWLRSSSHAHAHAHTHTHTLNQENNGRRKPPEPVLFCRCIFWMMENNVFKISLTFSPKAIHIYT